MWKHIKVPFNQKFGSIKSEIALIIDNRRVHPLVENLEWTELVFLLSNTTSHTQLIDQDVIRALKAKYRSLVIGKLTSELEKKGQMPTVSILFAMIMLGQTWNAASNKNFPIALKRLVSLRKKWESDYWQRWPLF